MFRVKRRGVLPLIVAIEKSKFRPTSAEQRPFEYDARRLKNDAHLLASDTSKRLKLKMMRPTQTVVTLSSFDRIQIF